MYNDDDDGEDEEEEEEELDEEEEEEEEDAEEEEEDDEDEVEWGLRKRIKLEEVAYVVGTINEEDFYPGKEDSSSSSEDGHFCGRTGVFIQKKGAKLKKEEKYKWVVKKKKEEVNRVALVMEKVPPEVWETIFSYLNTEEIQAVMNTCPRWHSVMASKRTKLFFPLLLPNLVRYLPPSSVLGLRQICKQWKQLVDSPLDNHGTSPGKFECHWWHNDTPFEHVFRYIEQPYLLNNSAEVENFGEIMSTHDHNQNPFISRTVTIKFEGGVQDFRRSHEIAVRFLQKFGHHIWDFTHFCPVLRGNENIVVTLLPQILQHLPNLKSLKVDWNSDGVMTIPPDVARFIMQENNFPAMPHMTSLNFDFRGGGELESVLGVVALLNRYGTQLDTFVCRGEFLERDVFTPEMIHSVLPNLKNLRLFCVTTKSLEKLSKLENYPLQRLQLWYSFHYLQFSHVVKAFSTFSASLVHLHIHVKLNYPLEGWGAIIVPIDYDTDDESPENSVELKMTFPNLVRFGAPVSSLNSPFFWELVKQKFGKLERLELQTAMEALFAPFEKAYLEREIQQSKEFFDHLPSLNTIRFWFHNKGSYTIKRYAL